MTLTNLLPLWNLPPNTRLTLLAERENRVYRPEQTPQPCVLRTHRPNYRSNAELNSELQWMAHLAQNGLSVATPIPSINQRYHEVIDGLQVDCLSWLDGKPLGNTGQPLTLTDRSGTFRQIGRTMAQLHQLSDNWEIPEGFTRPHWNLAGLLGEQPLWGRFWENPQLSASQRKLLETARNQATQTLAAQDSLDYGLIHADMVRENILLGEQGIQLLDFDDSGFGYRLFELATALLKNRDEPDYPELEQALIEGYRSVRPLDTEWLPLFMLLRAFTYVGWIIPRMAESGSQQRCERFITTATTLAEEYLA